MAKKTPMSEAELSALISGQIADARTFDGNGIADHREWALKFFNGEVDIAPMGKNRSKFVSRDVADTHGLILPGLLRVFFGSDRIVVYEPTRPEHDEYSEQVTDYVNYVVMKRCDGYRQFRSTFSDGLLFGNGILKHWWDKTPVYTTDDYTRLGDAEFAYITGEPDVEEVIDHLEYEDPEFIAPEPDPAMIQAAMAGDPQALQAPAQTQMAPTLHDFTVKRLKRKGQLILAATPNEEFILERTAKVLDETVRFCAHVQRKTRSDLVKEGYDKKKIDDIPAFSNFDPMERDEDSGMSYRADTAPDKSTEYVQVYECYVLLDYNGDGIAERRRIISAGTGTSSAILANDEWGDDLPFSDIVPDPMSHAWKGRDLYEEMGDIQRIKTVGLRGLLDNMYQQLAPQRDVEMGSYENPDELIDPTFGGVLWRKQGRTPLTEYIPQTIAPNVFPVLEYLDGVGEKRTGISQRSAALDMDALQNQTATAVNAAQAATHSKTEEYARNISECGGMKRVFSCILRLIVKHQDKPEVLRLRGEWVEMDPKSWNADMDVTINTGLGTGSREKDMAMLQGVAAKQEQIVMQFGPFNPHLNVGHLLSTYQKMAEASNIKNADSFFPDISQEEVAQLRQQQEEAAKNGPQDPRLQEAQMKAQLDQQSAAAKQELERQRDEAKMLLQKQNQDMQIELQRQKQEMELSLQSQLASAQLELQRQKQDADIAFAARKAEFDASLKKQEMMLEAFLSQQANAMKAQVNNTADTNIQEQVV